MTVTLYLRVLEIRFQHLISLPVSTGVCVSTHNSGKDNKVWSLRRGKFSSTAIDENNFLITLKKEASRREHEQRTVEARRREPPGSIYWKPVTYLVFPSRRRAKKGLLSLKMDAEECFYFGAFLGASALSRHSRYQREPSPDEKRRKVLFFFTHPNTEI